MSFPSTVPNIFASQSGYVPASQLDTDFAAALQMSQYLLDTGSANAYFVSPNPAWAAYANFMPINFVCANTNTANSTLQVSGLSAINIVNQDGTNVYAGQLVAGGAYQLVYYSGNFILAGGFDQATAGPTATQFSWRNLISNGNMEIAQRNTTFTAVTAGQYTLDRWYCVRDGVQAFTVTQAASAPAGLSHSLHLQRPAADVSLVALAMYYSMESRDAILLASQIVTFSFYAKAGANYSAGSNILNCQVLYGTGTDEKANNYTGATAFISQSVTLSTSWQRFTFTGTVGASATEVGCAIYYTPVGTAGADDGVYVTGVQLERGGFATPFERRLFGVELQSCLRYYEKSFPYATAPVQASAIYSGCFTTTQVVGSAATQFGGNVYYQVRKRATPGSVGFYNPGAANGQARNGNTAADCSSTTILQAGELGFSLSYVTAAGSAVGQANYLHWSADSEI